LLEISISLSLFHHPSFSPKKPNQLGSISGGFGDGAFYVGEDDLQISSSRFDQVDLP
jgi:hypothetical protein